MRKPADNERAVFQTDDGVGIDKDNQDSSLNDLSLAEYDQFRLTLFRPPVLSELVSGNPVRTHIRAVRKKLYPRKYMKHGKGNPRPRTAKKRMEK